jgi:hypothetical protein
LLHKKEIAEECGQRHQVYGFHITTPIGWLPSEMDSLMAWSCCPKCYCAQAKDVMWVLLLLRDCVADFWPDPYCSVMSGDLV